MATQIDLNAKFDAINNLEKERKENGVFLDFVAATGNKNRRVRKQQHSGIFLR